MRDNIQAQAYRYQLMPSEPLTKDKPKRFLILLLGALLGVMVGAAGVLVDFAIVNRSRRLK